jgi:hypothetical protein
VHPSILQHLTLFLFACIRSNDDDFRFLSESVFVSSEFIDAAVPVGVTAVEAVGGEVVLLLLSDGQKLAVLFSDGAYFVSAAAFTCHEGTFHKGSWILLIRK